MAAAGALRGFVRGGGRRRCCSFSSSALVLLLSPLRAALGLPVCRMKSSISFLTRPDRPKLAYHRLKGRNPGVIFLPGFNSNMNGQKATALEDFCSSLGHAFVRFDFTGCGSSDGNLEECTIGKWRKDVLSILDELTDGPQILVGSSLGGWLMIHAAIARPDKVAALVGVAAAADHLVTTFKKLPIEDEKAATKVFGKTLDDINLTKIVCVEGEFFRPVFGKTEISVAQKEIEEKGQWKFPTKYNEEGYYSLPYDFIKEAENHCVLNSPIPVTCPIRLIHGMKDEDVPWQISMQVAERVLSKDVDVILRKGGQHRMSEKEDIKLLVNTVDDLIDKLAILA